MFTELRNDDDRGQVGIGTLIVFIAMVLVAAIAAGVLINTAGFLQSSAEQTGQESSAQVTNQIQVASKVGLVSGSGPTESIVFDSTGSSGSLLTIDNASTVTIERTTSGDSSGTFALTSSGSSNQIDVEDGDTLRFEQTGAATVQVVNTGTGASFSMSTSDDLTLKQTNTHTNADGFRLRRTYEGPTGSNTLQTLELVEDAASGATDLPLSLQDTSEQHLVLSEDTDGVAFNVNDGEVVTVTSVGGSTSLDPGGAGSMSVQANDELTFEIVSTTDVKITNQRSGATVTFDATANEIATGANSVTLEDADGNTVDASSSQAFGGLLSGDIQSSESSISTPQLLLNQEFSSGGGGVSELNIIAIKGSGADQINLERTTITTIGPGGSNTLTYSSDSATEDETFTVEAIQDSDDSLPVMTGADRFRIIIDPGTLGTGESMTLEVTTESGATTEIRVSPPNTLAGQSAVQV